MNSNYTQIMINALQKASRVIFRDFYEIENIKISKKGPMDFATHTDHNVQRIIVSEIKKSVEFENVTHEFILEENNNYNHDQIIEEEYERDNKIKKKYRWIIDPIDGTSNFIMGNPIFSMSIALQSVIEYPNNTIEEEIVSAAIYIPILNETYWAEKNGGAFAIDSHGKTTRLIKNKLSLPTSLEEDSKMLKVLGTRMLFNASDHYLSMFNFFRNKQVKIRMTGSIVIDMVYMASNKFTYILHENAKIWDVAAGSLILQELNFPSFSLISKERIYKANDFCSGFITTNYANASFLKKNYFNS